MVLNFFLFRVLPGDPAATLGRGRFKTEEQREAFREQYGLDESLGQQFLTYLGNLAHGDLGVSLRYRVPVSDLIADRLPITLLLVGTSTILAIVIGVWIGILERLAARWWLRPVLDRLEPGALLDAGVVARPAADRGLRGGDGSVRGHLPDRRAALDRGRARDASSTCSTRPGTSCCRSRTLTLAFLAEYALVMRSSLLDELGEDYLITARAKGLRDIQVRRHHAVRNALLPTTTVAAISIGFIVSGAITIETIFSIPGLGLLEYEAISIPDYWVLQGTFLIAAAGVILANLLVNLAYGLIDPRVRT